MKFRNILFIALLATFVSVGCGKNTDKPSDPPEQETPDPTPGKDDEEEWTGDYPKGVEVIEFNDELSNGKKCLGFAVTVDFSKNDKLKFTPYYTVPMKKPSEIYKEYGNRKDKACIVINGGYFSGTKSIGLCISDGKLQAQGLRSMNWPNDNNYQKTVYPVRSALGQMEDGKFEITWAYQPDPQFRKFYSYPSALDNNEKTKTFMETPPTAESHGAQLWSPVNALAAGPRLVEKGKNVAETNYWKEVLDSGGTAGLSRQPRTAAGITADNKLILLVCDGRGNRGSAGFTLVELADKLISLGAVDALNFDGGGSSAIVGKDGAVLNSPSDKAERRIVTSIVISERQ